MVVCYANAAIRCDGKDKGFPMRHSTLTEITMIHIYSPLKMKVDILRTCRLRLLHCMQVVPLENTPPIRRCVYFMPRSSQVPVIISSDALL